MDEENIFGEDYQKFQNALYQYNNVDPSVMQQLQQHYKKQKELGQDNIAGMHNKYNGIDGALDTTQSAVMPMLQQYLKGKGPDFASNAKAGGIGLGLSIGGTMLKKASDDQNATTLNFGEGAGSTIAGAGFGLSSAATLGAAFGSTLGPLGIAAGAGLGAMYGLGKGLYQRNRARKELGDITTQTNSELNRIAGQSRAEAMKGRTYSGYDFGTAMYKNGGVKLPGGTMHKIPGTNAVEFKGNTHEKGGILMDPMTEVEHGETMDKVDMKGKGPKDYFFSSFLKTANGKSFADTHKDILRNGGSRQSVNMLARMQEYAAGRNPNSIETSTPEKYQTAGQKRDYDENNNPILTAQELKALQGVYKDVPNIAIGAGAAQLIPAAYSFLHKEKAPVQVGPAGRISAPTLNRVDMNPERAANAANMRSMSNGVNMMGAGPAGIVAKMAAYRQKHQNDMQIAAQEQRANMQIENQEAGMQMQADQFNVSNALRNEMYNAQVLEKQRIADENRKYMGLDSAAKSVAGLAGDVMSYKGQERYARAIGSNGIYERDKIFYNLAGKIGPEGKPYTKDDIAKLYNLDVTKENTDPNYLEALMKMLMGLNDDSKKEDNQNDNN